LTELTLAEPRDLVEDFAFYLMTKITEVSVITQADLAAAALVCHDSSNVTETEFAESVDLLAAGLKYYEIEISSGSTNLTSGCNKALDRFKSRKFIESESTKETLIYKINESRRANLEFYKNSLVNCLWAPALLATAIISENSGIPLSRKDILTKFCSLKKLLQKELIFDPLVEEGALVENNLMFFEKQGWINVITSTGSVEVTRNMAMKVFRGLLSDILRVYKACAATLNKIGDESILEREFIKLAAKTGAEMKLFPSSQNISLSTVTVKNALNQLTALKMVDYNQARKKIRRGKEDSGSLFKSGPLSY
ncbi:MAG: hypothetical protein ACP5VS_02910, partial [Desulfomonilaceae bacterium]